MASHHLPCLLVWTACLSLSLANHLQRPQFYSYEGHGLAREDKIFLDREALTAHQQSVRSPLSLTSPFPYKYPYYSALTGTSLSPSLPPPQPRSKYDYPFPPIPTYPPSTTRAPLLPRAPAITFLDPEPDVAPHIEVIPRSFTPRPVPTYPPPSPSPARPQTGGGGQLYERDQEEAEEDSQEMGPSVMIFSQR